MGVICAPMFICDSQVKKIVLHNNISLTTKFQSMDRFNGGVWLMAVHPTFHILYIYAGSGHARPDFLNLQFHPMEIFRNKDDTIKKEI